MASVYVVRCLEARAHATTARRHPIVPAPTPILEIAHQQATVSIAMFNVISETLVYTSNSKLLRYLSKLEQIEDIYNYL